MRLTCKLWLQATVLSAVFALTSLTSSGACAEAYRVMSGDTLRVDVFLSPEHSAEVRIDDAGDITLPAIGRVHAGGRTAEEIENMVREKLTNLSDISGVRVVVSVTEYRPIFVLGFVNNPGRYPYSPHTTVLQALALASGIGNPVIRRNALANNPADLVDRQANYQVQTLQYWSALARHARLLAEQSGADTINFPADLVDQLKSTGRQGVLEREKEVFNARKQSLADNLEVLDSQKKVVQQEIASSKNYADDVARSVPEIQKELDTLTALRNKGLTRQIEVLSVQRYVSDLQQQRQQSNLTVTRSGRELNDIDKQAAGLATQRQAEVAQALVDTETEIATLRARLDNESKLLVGTSTLPSATGAGAESETAVTYKIVRLKIDGTAATMAADENTLLVPGDVLEVVAQPATHGN